LTSHPTLVQDFITGKADEAVQAALANTTISAETEEEMAAYVD
jgi:hypothetical protein